MLWLRRFVMIVVPIALVALEWHHPAGFSKDVFHGLNHLASFWQWLHMAQSFLFGGIAVAAFLLTYRINNVWGILSKIFVWTFAVCYLVFDSTAGIAVGSILQIHQQNPQLDTGTVQQVVQKLFNDPVIGGVASVYSLMGSWSWLLGIGCAIVALFLDNKGSISYGKLIPPLCLLLFSGLTLFVGHYYPYGPLAFSSFALAGVWFEYFHYGPAREF